MAAASKFLEYFAEIRRIHKDETGVELKEYKPTEPDRLAQTFHAILALKGQGIEFLTEMMHRLVWAQCLGNGNHRTSVLFLQAFLDSAGITLPEGAEGDADKAKFQVRLNEFTEASHKYLDRQNEWGFGAGEFERRHRGLCRQWLEKMIGDQSELVATVGPQRLMTFLS